MSRSAATPFEKLQKAVEAAAAEIGGVTTSVTEVAIGAGPKPAILIDAPPSAQIYVVATADFPDAPPVLSINWGGSQPGTQLSLAWGITPDWPALVRQALVEFIAGPGPFRPVWGIDPKRPQTEDDQVGAAVGWRRMLSGYPLANDLARALPSRVPPQTLAALDGAKVLVAGLGSVGSYMAEQLVRSGVSEISGLDFDTVDGANLSRSVYTTDDVGGGKAAGLQRRLLAINPAAKVTLHRTGVETVGPEALRELFAEADVIVAATDNPETQGLINRCAHFAKKSVVFAGLYRGALGGEMILMIPTLTPCYHCQTGGVRRSLTTSGQDAERDYGSGRLQGEAALCCDIHHVSSAAVKMVLSALVFLRTGSVDGLAGLAVRALQQRTTFAAFGMAPDYWIFPEVVGDAAGQLAFQSVWLSAGSEEDCAVCGAQAEPEDPFPFARASPGATQPRS